MSKADEEPDYYIENGFLVFTEAFHLKRGYCCNSGCRHCPYKRSNPAPPAEEETDNTRKSTL